MITFVTLLQTSNAIIDLAENCLPWPTPTRAKTAVITEGTPPSRDRTIHVRTGETAIHAHPLDPNSKPLTQKEIVGKIP